MHSYRDVTEADESNIESGIMIASSTSLVGALLSLYADLSRHQTQRGILFQGANAPHEERETLHGKQGFDAEAVLWNYR